MEIAGFLAANAVAVLAPALGRLLRRTGERLANKASDRVSDAAVKKAEELWKTVRPKVESSPGAKRAAERLAQQPDNEDFQAALRVELDELLANDPRFRRDVERKLLQIGITHVEQKGDHSIMVGHDNHGTIIQTESYHSYSYGGGRTSQLDDFREANPIAKALIAIGLVIALLGFVVFLIPIFEAFTDNSRPGDPGFGVGPDPTPAAIGFAIMLVGIVLGGIGSLIAGFTKRRPS